MVSTHPPNFLSSHKTCGKVEFSSNLSKTDDWSKETLKATYSMANIVPQTKRANRYKFVSLEKLEREMAVKHGVLEMLTLVFFNDTIVPKIIFTINRWMMF